jgi:formylglycine-generating enzyme required for sulfatase activity
MRVELVPNIIDTQEQAVNLADSLNAHAVIGAESWMTSDSLQIAVMLVGEEENLLFPFDIDGVYSHPREIALTQSDFEQYGAKMVAEANDWNLDKIIRQLSGAEDPETGTVADVPGDFLLAQLILAMTQVFPVEVPDYTRWADNIVMVLAEQGYFASLLFADKFGLPIAFVPSGAFTMGRNAGEAEELCLAYSNACNVDFFASEPPIEVLVDKFFIDAYEVSNWAYQQCIDVTVCPPPDSFDSETRGDYFFDDAFADYPVVNVPWEYAMIYCEWRNGRLPTEAEWEKAARWFPAHGSQNYPWSHNFDDDTPTPDLANYDVTPGDTVAVYEYEEARSPVGTLNQAGNVWEWTADWFDPDYYAANGDSLNPTGPQSGMDKIFRGGSFGNAFASGLAEVVDPARRGGHEPFGNRVTGFRCAYDTLEYSNQ